MGGGGDFAGVWWGGDTALNKNAEQAENWRSLARGERGRLGRRGGREGCRPVQRNFLLIRRSLCTVIDICISRFKQGSRGSDPAHK